MKLKKILKRTFIPHKENNYKPDFFHEHVLLSILTGALLLLLLSLTSYTILRTTKLGSTIIVSVLTDLTNKNRKENNLPPLKYSSKLEEASHLKGEDMATRQYFSHYAPDGTSPWYWIKHTGYDFIYAGENLAVNFKNSHEVNDAWLASKKHKENILDPRYEDIGIATVQGTTHGKSVLFVVQMFGKNSITNQENTIEKNTHIPWYAYPIFDTTYYVKILYHIVISIIIIALLLMVFIEMKHQHYRHILYGILLITIVIVCTQINRMLM